MADEDRKKQQKAAQLLLNQAAERFRALGDPTRLHILQYLRTWEQAHAVFGDAPIDGGAETAGGASVTEISRAVAGGDKISSTFSHHLKELRHAGLISVERHGKSRWYRLVPEAVDALVPFICGDGPHPVFVAAEVAKPAEKPAEKVAEKPAKAARKSAKSRKEEKG